MLLMPIPAFAEITAKVTLEAPHRVLVFKENGRELARQVLDQEWNVVESVGQIPDGPVRRYFDRGSLEEETYYSGGKLDGTCRQYTDEGMLWAERNYKNGRKDGPVRLYYSDGSLLSESYFVDDKREGAVRSYYENGNLWFEETYRDGKQEGISRYYQEDGKLQWEDIYRNNTLVQRKVYNDDECRQGLLKKFTRSVMDIFR